MFALHYTPVTAVYEVFYQSGCDLGGSKYEKRHLSAGPPAIPPCQNLSSGISVRDQNLWVWISVTESSSETSWLSVIDQRHG